jgi:hypothetical protein
MPLSARQKAGFLIAAALVPLGGCYRRPPASLQRARLVGTYVYHCADPTAPHAPDRLTLRSDGTYVLLQVPGGGPATAVRGKWRLYGAPAWGGGPQIDLIGRGSYPIRVKGDRIRLLIDLDLGHWYQKTG